MKQKKWPMKLIYPFSADIIGNRLVKIDNETSTTTLFILQRLEKECPK